MLYLDVFITVKESTVSFGKNRKKPAQYQFLPDLMLYLNVFLIVKKQVLAQTERNLPNVNCCVEQIFKKSPHSHRIRRLKKRQYRTVQYRSSLLHDELYWPGMSA